MVAPAADSRVLSEATGQPLQVVCDELAVTLNQARTALEQFAEGESGTRPLDRFVALLHTARGVLQLAEVWGGSLLAEEMEQTCRHLLKMHREGQADEGLEALMRAAVQLPAYIERIRNGGRDVPLVLLPLLNDLRAARGRPLLSESTLLLLNAIPAASAHPSRADRQPSGEDVAVLAQTLRPRFQLSLLGWIRGDGGETALSQLAEVVNRLEAAATLDVVHQLWWVAGGVLEALQAGGLESSVSVKRLIGQADREMKRLSTAGEQRYAGHPPTDLVNNLLYYVARATSMGPRVAAIRESFSLSGLIPGDEQVESARQSLAAPSVRLMQTVAGAIREDLARVKDVLDIYVRTGMEKIEELAPQIELLKKIADTLGVLGLGDLREVVNVRRTELEDLVAGRRPVDESDLVAMAAAILAVEDRLEHDLVRLITPVEPAGGVPAPAASEDQDQVLVTQAVMRECLANLARVKEAITLVTERGGEAAALDAMPALLRGITAALLLLERDRAATTAQRIADAAGEVVRLGAGGSGRPSLERLADAIVSLEYYMETLQAGRREPDWMLDNAARCLDALDLQPHVVTGPEDGRAAARDLPATVVITPQPRAPSADRPVVGSGATQIDPEILELFIEEAREAVEAINVQFPAWEVDDSDRDALLVVRRAFHTLKGSGRMVGAELIGEFCWTIERLLNRVIDGTVTRTPELLAVLRRAIAAVPELLEQLEVGTPPATDIGRLIADTEALTLGGPLMAEPDAAAEPTQLLQLPSALVDGLPDQEPWSAGSMVDEEPGQAPADWPEPPSAPADTPPEPPARPAGMDPLLLEILSREAATHLEVIRAFAQRTAAAGSQPVPEQVFRACHTLHGSLTMAAVESAVAVAGPLHELIAIQFETHVPADGRTAEVTLVAAAAIEDILASLPDVPSAGTDLPALAERLRGLAADVAERAATPPDEGGDGGTVSMVLPVIPEPLPPPVSAPVVPAGEATAVAADATVAGWDAELADIFAEEARELLEACDSAVVRVTHGDGESVDALAELQRCLHTLKGGARMSGLAAMGDLSHDLETLLIRVDEGQAPAHGATWSLVQAALDELHTLRDQIPAGIAAPPAPALMARLSSALHGAPESTLLPAELPPAASPAPSPVLGEPQPVEFIAADTPLVDISEPVPEPIPEPVPEQPAAILAVPDGPAVPDEAWPEIVLPEGAAISTPAEPLVQPPAAPPALERLGELARALQAPPQPLTGTDTARDARVSPEAREYARVDSGLLDQLLNGAGEISIANARLTQQLSQIQFNLEELNQTVVRLREQLRKLEIETETQILHRHQADGADDAGFDPLELDRYSSIQQLSRGLAETASDVSSLKDLLQNLSVDTEGLLVQQARTTNELQDGLMRTRMVPFDQHASRLARLVRQTAKEQGKTAELVIEGSGELDRQVLEKMLPPFEHMLRNAVVHGIEPPAERLEAGKPATGRLRIGVRREGAEVVLDIEDDGRGLDIAAIRRRAVEQGFATTEAAITDEEAMQFILRPGFSTAGRITQSAGRGIGMDVVASQVAKFGGALTISSNPGLGTTFTLRLPFTLAVTQALIVRTGPELFALPLPTVEGIIRITRPDFMERMAGPDPGIDYGGQRYGFRHLGQYVGLGPARLPDEQERLSIILVRAGENSTALITDEMLDSREIVVKAVGAQLATVRGIAGATILGDGRIVVILDVGALVRTPRTATEEIAPAAEPEPSQPVALVVDDSITMRRVTQRLLERNGFRVLTAKDGVEAIGVLQDHRPDIILLDVEMPRMDGYEFARHVRNNPQTAALPIIMVTSRVSEKHRARAIEIGVNDYLGKPYQERQLLDAVNHLLYPG